MRNVLVVVGSLVNIDEVALIPLTFVVYSLVLVTNLQFCKVFGGHERSLREDRAASTVGRPLGNGIFTGRSFLKLKTKYL